MCRQSAIPGPPSLGLLMLEGGRAVSELLSGFLSRPLLRSSPRGDGHPVLLLPGFLASDLSTRPLRSFLRELGYWAHPWGLGRNLGGPRAELEQRILDRLAEVHERHDRKVSLVGWSLGGVYAREIARRIPERVRQVITMGSPFAGPPRANRSWWLFERLSGERIDAIPAEEFAVMRQPPPVPTTAIYSRTDGVTAWQSCLEREGPRAENIEVPGSHLGLGFNPLTLYAIADRLAQAEGSWRPFAPDGTLQRLYPEPAKQQAGA